MFVSVKFYAEQGIGNIDKAEASSGLTSRRFPYLRRMETPRSTASAYQRKIVETLRGFSHKVDVDRMVSRLRDFCESCNNIPDKLWTQTFLPKLECPEKIFSIYHHLDGRTCKNPTSHSKKSNLQSRSSFRQSDGVYQRKQREQSRRLRNQKVGLV